MTRLLREPLPQGSLLGPPGGGGSSQVVVMQSVPGAGGAQTPKAGLRSAVGTSSPCIL